jgi:hypothetical protein
MRSICRFLSVVLTFAMAVGPAFGQNVAAAKPPVIEHDPVTWVLRGQALTLKAKILQGDAPVKSVTLYYALFRDAAPFRVEMRASGLGHYVGTIDAGMLGGVDTLSYYIEAQDQQGTAAETAWTEVKILRPDQIPADEQAAAQAAAAPVASKEEKNKGWTVALVAGGAAALVGGAFLLAGSDSGGGGSSDGGGTPPANAEGTYGGTSTTCFSPSVGSTTCDTTAMTILIDNAGNVLSETLVEGQQLTGKLSGSNFTLTASPPSGAAGEINFNGTVIGSRIVGSITGSAQDGLSVGIYSGSFSANKQ